ncbi:DUF4468 domain-containing protein [Tenacibaculum aestuarii]|uniref:DUF4468 domain-containing protein n=1 Tax=Tenacibaculum aestuarii TaxID=362781 RepID=UPI0038946B94
MKKLTLLLLLISTVCFGQQFELTTDGFKNDEKDYIVVEVPNKNALNLFNETKLFITENYKSAKEVMSVVEGEMITISGRELNKIRRNSFHVFDIDYSLTIKFKDGKVRFDAPTFKLTTFTHKHQVLHLNWDKGSLTGDNLGIYRKGKLKSKKAKADLELFFNTLIEAISKTYTKEVEDW